MSRRVVVVGGGYAGVLCAARLARKARGAAEVVLVSARPWFVERIRLHEDAAGGGPARRPLSAVVRETGVRLLVGTVTELDLERRRAAIELQDGVAREAFDDLVLATGSVGRRGHGPAFQRAWSCATEAEALALRARLAQLPGARVVIIGGGLTAIELAAELAEHRPDLRITLVAGDAVAFMLGASGRAHVLRVLDRLGVTVREHERVAAVEESAVILGSGEAVAADAAVWCGGFEAAPLARDAGLTTDELGRAFVDARLRSVSHPFVRVAGDAAHVALRGPGDVVVPARMACATALPQGAFCADDLARESGAGGEGSERELSFAYAAQCVSLGRRDGIIQHVSASDIPTRWWVGGRAGAWLKELVCRYAFASHALERSGLGYHWPHAPALGPGSGPPREMASRTP